MSYQTKGGQVKRTGIQSIALSCILSIVSDVAPASAIPSRAFPAANAVPQSRFCSVAVVPPELSPLHPFVRFAKLECLSLVPKFVQAAAPWVPFAPHLFNYPAAAVYWGMANLPPRLTRPERMRLEVEKRLNRKDSPEDIAGWLIKQYLRPPPHPARVSHDEVELWLTQTSVDISQFLKWLRGTRRTKRLTAVYVAVKSQQLIATALKGSNSRTQAAMQDIDDLKQMGASNALLDVANQARDLTIVASAIDALIDLKAIEELQQFQQGRFAELLRKLEGRHEISELVRILMLFGRFETGGQALRYQNSSTILNALAKIAVAADDESARQAFQILTGQASVETARDYLRKLKKPHGEAGIPKSDSLLICMLAILRSMTEHEAFAFHHGDVEETRREIARHRWSNPSGGFKKPPTLADLTYKVGELLHRSSGDPAITAFLAHLFSMAALEQMDRLHDPPLFNAGTRELLAAAKAENELIANPQAAGEIQFAAILHAAKLAQNQTITGLELYRRAAGRESKTRVAGRSLSELAQPLFLHTGYKGPDLIDLMAHVRPRSEDIKEERWRVLVPGPHPDVPSDWGPIFEYIQQEKDPSLQEFLKEFLQYWKQLVTPLHFTPEVYAEWILDHWRDIAALVIHGRRPQGVKPGFLELHLTDRCHNDCLFCRGGLRHANPKEDPWINGDDAIAALNNFFALNPKLFTRLSSTIGEPTINPDILKVLDRLNTIDNGVKHHWGITTNGLYFRKGLTERMMNADYVHVSLDAGSNETYLKLKQPSRYLTKDLLDKPFDQVMTNIQQLIEMKKATGSTVKIIVSVLLQSENYDEIAALGQRLKAMGVDGFQVKMQHYDERRKMEEEEINEAFDSIEQLQTQARKNPLIQIMPVQDRATAHIKNNTREGAIPSTLCHVAALLGNVVIGPLKKGAGLVVYACCQYYGRTLPAFGDTMHSSILQIWTHGRLKALENNAKKWCDNCSPRDQFLNTFLEFLISNGRRHPEYFVAAESIVLRWKTLLDGQNAEFDRTRLGPSA